MIDNSAGTTTSRFLLTAIVMLGLCLPLDGCATYQPVQQGYAGPTAKLADSAVGDGDRCASFFFLEAYDGHDVPNALSVTERRNSGQGLAMTTEDYSRPVPAQEATLHLKGRTHCAAPIIEVGHTVYLIEGDVKFAPQQDRQYVIKGELRDDWSAIWVEDLSTGKQTGNKLRIKGSTALNRGALLLLGEGAAKSSQHAVEEIPPH